MRSRVERTLHLAAALLLVVALWRVWDMRDAPRTPVQATFSGAPTARTRDSLAALSRAGRTVRWAGDVAAMAVAVEPAREPGDRWRVASIAESGAQLTDALGPIDSLPPGANAITVRAPQEAWRVVAGANVAGARPTTRLAPKRVLVLGHAGWEAKFVVAALEEDGWGVDTRLRIGPRDITQGPTTPALARHAAVIVLDTTDVNVAQLAAYVRSGGGLVLAGEAAEWRASSLRAVNNPVTLTDNTPVNALGAAPVSVSFQRHAAGRIARLAASETWRWRMQGAETGVRDHRLFWSRLVGSVAHAERDVNVSPQPLTDFASLDAPSSAPVAELRQVLGPPSDVTRPRAPRAPPLPAWLGVLMLTALFAEWASRRARGAA